MSSDSFNHWIGMWISPDKIAHISKTSLPTPILFWHIRAIQGLNRPNITKYTWGW